jgi:amino-acid N-acetyltransferase
MKIRKAKPEDLDFLVKLLKDNDLCYEDIASKIGCMFLGHAGDGIVGIGGVEIYEDNGLLRSLVIQNQFRSMGLGKELCSELIEYARKQGVKELYLLTLTAADFFEKLGFIRTDRQKVPETISRTTEFTSLCPVTAACMVKKI